MGALFCIAIRAILHARHWTGDAMTQKSQYQLFWEAHRKSADLNNGIMEIINDPVNPLTNEDLAALIKKRPHVYGRFSGLVVKLGKVQP